MRRTDIDDDGAKILAGTSAPSSGPPLGQPLKPGKIPVEFRGRDFISCDSPALRFVSAEIYSRTADLDPGTPLSVSEPHSFARGRFQAARRDRIHAVLRSCGLPKILRAVIKEIATFMVDDPKVCQRKSIRDCENDAVNEEVLVRHFHAQPAVRMGAPSHVPGELVVPSLR